MRKMNWDKRHHFKKAAVLFAVFLLGFSQTPHAAEQKKITAPASRSVRTISASALFEKIRQKTDGKIYFILVDLRNEVDYGKGRIPGAVNLPAAKRVYPLDLVSQKDREVIFYGYSSGDKAAMNTPMWAANQGLSKVYLLEGGFKGWPGEIEK